MPMSREDKMEKVQRLLTAQNKTKEMLEGEPVTRELHPGTDIARNWTVITSAYCGLEQTLKYLLADEKGLTIEELIGFSSSKKGVAQNKARKNSFATHNLSRLYSDLQVSTKNILQEYYSRFQSLHSYIEARKVDDFLERVSGSKGTGYERWRYTLIQDRALPKNSPEALLAIWDVCIQVAEDRLYKNQEIWMPDKYLAWYFKDRLNALVMTVSVERQNKGESFKNISGEVKNWLWGKGHPLNAYADVFWHFSRYDTHGVEDASDWFSDTLTKWANGVLKDPATYARTSIRAFVSHAQGYSQNGSSIRWQPEEKRFKAVPWSMKKEFLCELPKEATIVGDFSREVIPFKSLWSVAKPSGCRVLENRSFKGPAEKDVWHCTLRVVTENAKKYNPVLSIWQKHDSAHGPYYMIEECPPEQMSQSIRFWIESAKKRGERKSR